jgi:hypothetical protein
MLRMSAPSHSTWCEPGLANTLTAAAALKSKFIADFQLVDSQKVGREMKLRVRRVKPFARSDYGRMKYRSSGAPKIKASAVTYSVRLMCSYQHQGELNFTLRHFTKFFQLIFFLYNAYQNVSSS